MSGFTERLSNLPPGVTDADIERQANGDRRMDDLKLVKANTVPASWKVLDDADHFVAQFSVQADALAFLALARLKRWSNGEWEDWRLAPVPKPSDAEIMANAESARFRHRALCAACLDGKRCAQGSILDKQIAVMRDVYRANKSTHPHPKGR